MFTFTLQYAEAMKIAKKVAHSVSKEEARYYLNGFLMHKGPDGKHYAASTDGHRMTRIEVSPQYSEGSFPDVIFPTAAIKQILGFKPVRAGRDKATVTIQVDPKIHHYEISCEDAGVSGKLIDGTYPDYLRVIPNYAEFRNQYGVSGFSSAYLADIFEAASYSTEDFKATRQAVRILFEGGSPGVVLEERDPKVLYVIMPMRSCFPEHKHPSLTEASEQTAATAA